MLMNKIFQVFWFYLMAGTGIFVTCPFLLSAQEGDNPDALLFRKEKLLIHSKMLNRDFEIQVSLPADYFRSEGSYPALYALDGNRSFGLISDMVNFLSFPSNEIPSLIVVSIGYPINGLEDWGALRQKDFTPTLCPDSDENWKKNLIKMGARTDIEVVSGGAALFLDFLRHELIPCIDSIYRTDPGDRALCGYSLGGLFTLYALFNTHEFFDRFYAGSPSTWWDDGVIFAEEEKFASLHDNLNVRLYMSAGELENQSMIDGMHRMAGILQNRNYKDLKIKTRIFDGETHNSCVGCATGSALKYLYGK